MGRSGQPGARGDLRTQSRAPFLRQGREPWRVVLSGRRREMRMRVDANALRCPNSLTLGCLFKQVHPACRQCITALSSLMLLLTKSPRLCVPSFM